MEIKTGNIPRIAEQKLVEVSVESQEIKAGKC
jgi:hypothetical protein